MKGVIKMKKHFFILSVTAALFLYNSCSINKMATKAVAKSFSGGGEAVFTSDDDPLLVEDALPLLLHLVGNQAFIQIDKPETQRRKVE